MTREQQLQFCKICKNHRLDFNRGIICKLTDEPADFEDSCETFEEDTVLKNSEQKLAIKRGVNLKLASKGERFLNRLLDTFFTYAFLFALGIIIALIAPEFLDGILIDEGNLLFTIFFIFLTLFYYIVMESLTGRTMAKFITRTKVVMENGDKPTFEVILTRSLCRLIPFDAFSFLGDDGVGWHDSLSKTRVISVKDE